MGNPFRHGCDAGAGGARQQRGRFFSTVKISGSHIASLAWIKAGIVDVAAIDSVT
ncbi:MAG: hypothetical protein VCE75_12795 [Alphaproteobacteria bacterium]|jgi:ABC-type phosphate/phosphonate transport system substrate-binding protein